jgi:hypothetical protein
VSATHDLKVEEEVLVALMAFMMESRTTPQLLDDLTTALTNAKLSGGEHIEVFKRLLPKAFEIEQDCHKPGKKATHNEMVGMATQALFKMLMAGDGRR